MILPPRSLPSRALALAVLGGLAAVIWLSAVAPIKTWYDDNEAAISVGIRALAALKSVVAQGRQAGPDTSTHKS